MRWSDTTRVRDGNFRFYRLGDTGAMGIGSNLPCLVRVTELRWW